MHINKQRIVLHMIFEGRYSLDQAGNVISHINKEPRAIRAITIYTGMLEYRLDSGYMKYIMCYGQDFAYLATYRNMFDPSSTIEHIDKDLANNRPDNLRCVSSKPFGPSITIGRKYLSPDEIKRVIDGREIGLSLVKLAEKFDVTRQTIARVVKAHSK